MPHVTRYTQDFTLSLLPPKTFAEYSQSLNFGPTHPKDNQLLKINIGCNTTMIAREISLHVFESDKPLTIHEILIKDPETNQWEYIHSSLINKEVIDTESNEAIVDTLSLEGHSNGIKDESIGAYLKIISDYMADHITKILGANAIVPVAEDTLFVQYLGEEDADQLTQLLGADGRPKQADGTLLVQYLGEELNIIPINQITCSETAPEMQYSETGLEITHSEL